MFAWVFKWLSFLLSFISSLKVCLYRKCSLGIIAHFVISVVLMFICVVCAKIWNFFISFVFKKIQTLWIYIYMDFFLEIFSWLSFLFCGCISVFIETLAISVLSGLNICKYDKHRSAQTSRSSWKEIVCIPDLHWTLIQLERKACT